jgi:hypothetical protein
MSKSVIVGDSAGSAIRVPPSIATVNSWASLGETGRTISRRDAKESDWASLTDHPRAAATLSWIDMLPITREGI